MNISSQKTEENQTTVMKNINFNQILLPYLKKIEIKTKFQKSY